MLDFRLSEDQEQIVSAVARTLEKEQGAGDRKQVARMGELGWIGIALPEACGGSGGTLVEGALVAYEFGRALASPDLLATQLAGLVAFTADELDLASALACGARSAGFCLVSADVDIQSKHSIDYFLQADAVTLYLRFRDDGLDILEDSARLLNEGECIDPGMILRKGEASSCKVLTHLVDADGKLAQSAMILVSAMLAGIALSSHDLAVAYTKNRKQFGRLIGEFQAIKHHCANMHVRERAAYSQTMHAAMLTAAGLGGAELQAMAALDISASAAVENSEMGVHIHGGMGFSEECAAHLYLKRAHLLRLIGASVTVGLPTQFERLSTALAMSLQA